MTLYALYIAIPLALFIQHIYYVTIENFRKVFWIYVLTFLVIPVLSILLYISDWISIYICAEVVLISILVSIQAMFIFRKTEKLDIDNYQWYEGIMSYAGMVLGIIICVFPHTNYYNEMIRKVCNSNEITFSKIIYFLLGVSYILYNRVSICGVNKILRKR